MKGRKLARSLSKSKYFRCGVVLLVVLILLVALVDKFYTEASDDREENFWRSPPAAKQVKNAGVIEVLLKGGRKLEMISQNKLAVENTNRNPLERFSDSFPKILCYILLSRSRVKTARVIKETWGSHCDWLLFFGGYEYPELPVTFLNVSEGYENLWGKTKAAILYLAGSSKFKDVQYFMKADDDTFVIVENLRKFINQSQVAQSQPVWFGFKLKHKRMSQGYMSGGAGYVFNRQALVRVSSVLRKEMDGSGPSLDLRSCNVDGEYGVEDLELGKCFLKAGVTSINTVDENGGEMFLPLSYESLLNGAVSSFHWIWSQAWNRVKTGERCCSQNLISMHEVGPAQMRTVYYLLYKNRIWRKQANE